MASKLKYQFRGEFLVHADQPQEAVEILNRIALLGITVGNISASAYRQKASDAPEPDED